MKKVLGLFILMTVVLFSGCNKNMITCTKESNDNITMIYEIYFTSGDIVKKVNLKLNPTSVTDVDDMCNMYENYVNAVDGVTIKCTDDGILITGYENTDDNMTTYTKEEITNSMEENGYTCE